MTLLLCHITIDTCINQFMFIVSYSTETTTMSTALTTVSTTVLVNNGGSIAGWIVGVTILVSLLAVSMIIILILFVYIKRLKTMIYRKSDNDIVMECSPAYATTEFKTKLVTLLTITLCIYTHTVLLMIC